MSALPPEADSLRALAFFSELADDDLLRVTRIGRRRAFGAGELLVERGSDSSGLFVLLSGRVSVDAGGAIQELGPGEFLGEMALLGRNEQAGTGSDFFGEHPALDRGRRSANVTALEPVEALVIEPIYFEPFLIENPSVAVAILRSVVGRLRDLQARLEGAE
jgi:CRP/FNR family transcriptional regulator, cyclic AMP receptor protein